MIFFRFFVTILFATLVPQQPKQRKLTLKKFSWNTLFDLCWPKCVTSNDNAGC